MSSAMTGSGGMGGFPKRPTKWVIQTDLADRVTGTTVAAGGIAISASCGNFSTSSGTPVDITNLSVTITTTGRPVRLAVVNDGSGNGSNALCPSANTVNVYVLRNGSSIGKYILSGGNAFIPTSVIQHTDTPAAGTYTYKLQIDTTTAGVAFTYSKLVAYET